MRTLTAAVGLLVLGAAGPLAAQQHQHSGPPGGAQRQAHMAQMMASDLVLEQKLAAVDSLEGDAKVEALAAVVKELVAQRRAMHARMSGAMHGMMAPPPDSAGN